MLDLMSKPNGLASGASDAIPETPWHGRSNVSCHEFIESAVSHLLIFNDVYVSRLPGLGITARKPSPPSELWLLPPQHVSFKAPASGYGLPFEYRYQRAGSTLVFPVNHLNGYCDLLHPTGTTRCRCIAASPRCARRPGRSTRITQRSAGTRHSATTQAARLARSRPAWARTARRRFSAMINFSA
jgi:hypothetical protein